MIKKHHNIILTVIGMILVGVLFLAKDLNFYGKRIQTNQQTIIFERAVSTPENKNSSLPEDLIKKTGYTDITSEAKITNEKKWLKYEFRKAYLNNKASSKPSFTYKNYDLYFPEEWKLYIKETIAFDENGKRTGDIGGADLFLVNGENSITIKQAVLSFSICTINDTGEPLVNEIDCGQTYIDVTNENNSIEYIRSMGNPVDKRFSVCDTTFFTGNSRDECSPATDVGLIYMHADNQKMLNQLAQIIRRVEIIE